MDHFSSYRIRLLEYKRTGLALARIGGREYLIRHYRARRDHVCANCRHPIYPRQMYWGLVDRRGKWRKTYIHKMCLL